MLKANGEKTGSKQILTKKKEEEEELELYYMKQNRL